MIGQILHFLRYRQLEITSGLKNSPGYVFLLKKLKKDIEIALTPTSIVLSILHGKHAIYICEKKDVVL